MKCCEALCQNPSQFICLCSDTKPFCLSHLYYHSEICKKPKKTMQVYSSYMLSLKSTINHVKKSISLYSKTCILSIHKSMKLAYWEIEKLEKSFKILSDFENPKIFENFLKIKENFFQYSEKISSVFESFHSEVIKKSKHTRSMSQPIDSLLLNFSNMDIEEEVEDYCQICQNSLNDPSSRTIKCTSSCSLCIKCRSLDEARCISCFRYYSCDESRSLLND